MGTIGPRSRNVATRPKPDPAILYSLSASFEANSGFFYGIFWIPKGPLTPELTSGTSRSRYNVAAGCAAGPVKIEYSRACAGDSRVMCRCLTAAVATRDSTDSFPRQSSSSASGVLIINPRHCLRNAGESRDIRESIAGLLNPRHEDEDG